MANKRKPGTSSPEPSEPTAPPPSGMFKLGEEMGELHMALGKYAGSKTASAETRERLERAIAGEVADTYAALDWLVMSNPFLRSKPIERRRKTKRTAHIKANRR